MKEDSVRDRLLLILALDALVTAIELIGSLQTHSLVLWENFYTGLFDGLLIAMNVWGVQNEFKQRLNKATRIADWSDILLALGFAAVICVGLFRCINGGVSRINGLLVFGVAFSNR